jgi:hypothetical protein
MDTVTYFLFEIYFKRIKVEMVTQGATTLYFLHNLQTNGPDKLEYYITLGYKGLRGTNTRLEPFISCKEK